MSTSIDIFSKITDYLEHRITMRELESWLVPMLPIYLLNPDSAAANLIGLIELGLAEIQAGIRSEKSFKRLLAQHSTRNLISLDLHPYRSGIDETMASTSSTTEARGSEWLDQSPSWHTEPQVEYV